MAAAVIAFIIFMDIVSVGSILKGVSLPGTLRIVVPSVRHPLVDVVGIFNIAVGYAAGVYFALSDERWQGVGPGAAAEGGGFGAACINPLAHFRVFAVAHECDGGVVNLYFFGLWLLVLFDGSNGDGAHKSHVDAFLRGKGGTDGDGADGDGILSSGERHSCLAVSTDGSILDRECQVADLTLCKVEHLAALVGGADADGHVGARGIVTRLRTVADDVVRQRQLIFLYGFCQDVDGSGFKH